MEESCQPCTFKSRAQASVRVAASSGRGVRGKERIKGQRGGVRRVIPPREGPGLLSSQGPWVPTVTTRPPVAQIYQHRPSAPSRDTREVAVPRSGPEYTYLAYESRLSSARGVVSRGVPVPGPFSHYLCVSLTARDQLSRPRTPAGRVRFPPHFYYPHRVATASLPHEMYHRFPL